MNGLKIARKKNGELYYTGGRVKPGDVHGNRSRGGRMPLGAMETLNKLTKEKGCFFPPK